jgi:cytochrome bd-type quinol oxidase subunit 1
MDILIWIGIFILIIALLLGFSVIRGLIKMSFHLLKWIIIALVIAAVVAIIAGWLGWF